MREAVGVVTRRGWMEREGSKESKESKKASGDEGEARALSYLLAQGLTLVQRNYRVARGPGARAGEIDLVMRDREGTLVFVEVRRRRSANHGGAAASVGHAKRSRLIYAATVYLQRLRTLPPCRFDVRHSRKRAGAMVTGCIRHAHLKHAGKATRSIFGAAPGSPWTLMEALCRWMPCRRKLAMSNTKESGRLRGRHLFCDLESDVRPKRELSVCLAQAPTWSV